MTASLRKSLNFGKALLLPAALYLVLLILIPERMGNLQSVTIMLNMTVIPTIVACGMSFGWISGILDFSIGSVVIFAGIAGSVCGNLFGLPGLFLGSIAAALLLEALVGGAFRLLRIPSLVVSMGALMFFEAAGYKAVNLVGIRWPAMSSGYYIRLESALTFLGTAPWNFGILFAVLLIYGLIFYRTRFSNQARVVGTDEIIARNVGIKPLAIKFEAYLVGGFFLGIAAALSAAYSGSATPQINMTTMSAVFRPMMATVIALSMGSLVPIPVGIFLGSLSMNIIFTGIIALGWSDELQTVILGLFLIVVLSVPKLSRDLSDLRRRTSLRGGNF